MFQVEAMENSEYDYRISFKLGPIKSVKYLGKITLTGGVDWFDIDHEPITSRGLSRLIITAVFSKFCESYIRIGKEGINLKTVTMHEYEPKEKQQNE